MSLLQCCCMFCLSYKTFAVTYLKKQNYFLNRLHSAYIEQNQYNSNCMKNNLKMQLRTVHMSYSIHPSYLIQANMAHIK